MRFAMNKKLLLALALGAGALAQTSCGPKKKAAIVLWIATDMPRVAIEKVHVSAVGTGGARPTEFYAMQEFRPGIAPSGAMMLPLPGSLALTREPGDNNTHVNVSIDVTPTSGNGTPFQVKARARFVNDEWRQLELFLPYQCSDEAIRRQCAERSMREGVEYTCGAAGSDPCILVERSDLTVFEADAGAPTFDVPIVDLPDARADGALDAGMDSGVDAGSDTGVDVRPIEGPPLPQMLPAWPGSGARFSGPRPTLVAHLPTDCMAANALEVVLCPGGAPPSETCVGQIVVRDPSFTGCSMNTRHAFTLPAARALRAGRYHWAMRLVLETPTEVRRGPLAWRPMTIAATTMAGSMPTSLVAVVPDIDGDGAGDLIVNGEFLGMPAPPLYAPMASLTPMSAILRDFEPYPVAGSGGTLFGWQMLVLGDAEADGTIDVLFTDPFTVSMGSTMYRFEYTGAMFRQSTVQPSFDAPRMMSGYGDAAASADFNRDGLPDLVLGGATSGEPVRVLYGTRSGYQFTTSQLLAPRMSIENFGARFATNCDLDADGYVDLVVAGGAFFAPQQVSVFYGGPMGLESSSSYDIPEESLRGAIGTGLGAALACNGDYNADGYADLAIGAYDGDANTLGGYIILSGGPTRMMGMTLQSSIGSAPLTRFGTVLQFVGDQDGQRGDELLVGEPGHAGGVGRIQLVGFRPGMDDVAQIESPAAPTLGRFGEAVVFLGPIGPDGQDGFAVGAPQGGRDRAGSVLIFHRDTTAMSSIPSITRRFEPIWTLRAAMGTQYGARFAR